MQDLIARNIEAVAFSAVEARGQVEGGLARILAVTARDRLPTFPDVPTTIEQGYDLDIVTWRGLATPRGVAAPVAARLQDAVAKVARDDRFVAFMDRQGFGIDYRDAMQFDAHIRREDALFRTYFSS